MIEQLRQTHDLVVVDYMSSFNDTTLAIIDLADTVLTMLSLEITSIKNIRLFLEVAEQLGYGSDKVRLVLNRADSSLGIRVADVEHSIGRQVDHTIVSDGRSVVYALNRGVPFFLSNREAQVSQDVLRLASAVAGTHTADAGESQKSHPEEVAVRMALSRRTTGPLAAKSQPMSLLQKRIESARPGAAPGSGSNLPVPTPGAGTRRPPARHPAG
ncbi:MAG: hypothetical protein U0838_04650 [Chloroflexota bacterium]